MQLSIFTLLLTLAFITVSCKPDKPSAQVPDSISAKMTTLYPDAHHITWETEGDLYEAHFKQGKEEKSVILDKEGSLFSMEAVIDPATLPQAINDYVAQQLNGNKIDEAERIIYADGDAQFVIKVGKHEYLFDAAGQFVKMEEEEKEDQD